MGDPPVKKDSACHHYFLVLTAWLSRSGELACHPHPSSTRIRDLERSGNNLLSTNFQLIQIPEWPTDW